MQIVLYWLIMIKSTKNKIATLLSLYAADLLSSPLLLREQNFIQHGNSSVYAHSVAVAIMSLWIARKLHMHVNEKAMARGALLHDYFLYDWHKKDKSHRWHGFRHARNARINAERDFQISKLEGHIIERHMFPLNIKPPCKKEGLIVCIADKICALREFFKR